MVTASADGPHGVLVSGFRVAGWGETVVQASKTGRKDGAGNSGAAGSTGGTMRRIRGRLSGEFAEVAIGLVRLDKPRVKIGRIVESIGETFGQRWNRLR